MLTVAIASGDKNTSSQLLASLEQTGLIGGSVKHWSMPSRNLLGADTPRSMGRRWDRSRLGTPRSNAGTAPDAEPCSARKRKLFVDFVRERFADD